MIKTKWKFASIIIGILAIFIVAGCSSDEKDSKDGKKSISKDVDYTITGIEPGAGISENAEKALKEYDSLKGWELKSASTGAMISELDTAIRQKKPIIITGWTPHWIFADHPELKFLKDPKKVFGKEDEIRTIVRKGLDKDDPNLVKLVDQYHLDQDDLEKMMKDINKEDTDKVTAKWVEDNPDKVDAWTKGVKKVHGKTAKIVSTPWDSNRVTTGVMKKVMEDMGYKVKDSSVNPSIMFESIANGDSDVTFGVWMPVTHKAFYDKYKDKFDDLGPVFEGAKLGLVVPDYMDIDSIEDLEPKK